MQGTSTISLFLSQAGSHVDLKRMPLAEPQLSKARSLSGKRQVEFCVGRLLLHHALNAAGHQTHNILEQKDNAPIVSLTGTAPDENSGRIRFSISHSKGWVALAFCESEQISELGLDIEKVKPSLCSKQAAYFCNNDQIARSQELSEADTPGYFTRLWTHKEAFCKSQGLSVFSAEVKAAEFDQDRRMRSALLHDDYYVSVFSSPGFSSRNHDLSDEFAHDALRNDVDIDVQFLTINANGKLSEGESQNLNWEI